MDELFNELNNDLEMSMIAAEAGIEAVDTVIDYYATMLQAAADILCEQMNMTFDQVIYYLEEKVNMVGLLERAIEQLTAIKEVNDDLI